ncbi:MAG TPA: ATP-binding protein [Solirubrobacteraceae bacterium]|nr:ATP-binding protein [Solirubrobacteraceae bacterium]
MKPALALPYEVQLPRGVWAAGRARKLLAEHFAPALAGRELDTAKLLISELVTNAVVHGEGSITMRVDLDASRLLVEVIDEGTGFERAVRARHLPQDGGWGLKLVDSEASRWGIREGTTHVWFELERPGRAGSSSGLGRMTAGKRAPVERNGGEACPPGFSCTTYVTRLRSRVAVS